MRLNRRGIKFNVWLDFFAFAIAIVLLLGILQFSLIKPYYRNDKIRTVKDIVNQIHTLILTDDKVTELNVRKAYQVTVDNSVCAVIYNSQGTQIYKADNLGTSCVFNQNLVINEESVSPTEAGAYFKNHIEDGEYSVTLTNSMSNQEMIIYGEKIPSNLGTYYVFVNSPLEPVDSITNFFRDQYAIYTIIVIVLSLLVSFFISNKLSKPIVNMKKSADNLAEGHYDVTFEGSYFTETNELANTLNDATNKLSKVDELRKDLIANISHDIKTPLTMIKAYAEMIRDISGDNPQKREEHLDVIIKEVDYLDHLVVDMNELSKMQSGSYELNEENFDLAQKIRDIVFLNQVMIEEGELEVIIQVPDSLVIYADPIKIGQVIYNFLSNSIKHTPNGKKIWVRAFRKDDFVRVEVEDQGEGIKEEDIPYIWDRYQKIDKTFTRNLESTGLGLAIVKAILDTHHAKYGVESKEGKGSLFYFELEQENVI